MKTSPHASDAWALWLSRVRVHPASPCSDLEQPCQPGPAALKQFRPSWYLDRCRVEGMPVWTGWLAMGRSGGDRLSRVLRHSTMGAGVFNGRVRDGIGFWARRSGHQTGASQFVWHLAAQGAATSGAVFGKHAAVRLLVFLQPYLWLRQPCGCRTSPDTDHESDQANRAISTGRLNASPRVHPP